ncbi:S8 family serine peptidase [Tabrizicola sp.]|uniref:S8 family serine peptidase n=1 Tax=Tabrizicola sp. TaxID=2005166 RepID=UPI0027337CDF|nr:S8 family serine peptidase [Tabrizicola sp.]MDP3195414.1 S8 family serine peptidase [Tabrizicola sp.]
MIKLPDELPTELTFLETFTTGAGDQPLGKGLRPAYHALWHLKALGVVDDLTSFRGAWDRHQAGTEVRVAVIDTPVAHDHPNLQGAIDLALMRDFSIHDEGVFVVPTDDGPIEEAREKLVADLPGWTGTGVEEAKRTIQKETAKKDDRPYCAPRYFGAHGTAIAGLIGARPAGIDIRKPASLVEPQKPSYNDPLTLPYAGVNPFCSIIPITTSASPDPDMVLAALNYARLIKPDIVVIAAAWEDQRHRKSRWAKVDEALLALCKDSVVLCAAGNSGDIDLAYPACLSVEPGGPIAVTACDKAGNVLAYAPDPQKNDRVLRTLSSWSEAYSNKGVIRDPWKAVDPMIVQPADDPTLGGPVVDLPAEGLIALDAPGPYGYNPSPFRYRPSGKGPHFDVGSLYCQFSGTSAATALAAGLIGLAIQESGKSSNSEKAPETLKPGKKALTYAEAKKLYR